MSQFLEVKNYLSISAYKSIKVPLLIGIFLTLLFMILAMGAIQYRLVSRNQMAEFKYTSEVALKPVLNLAARGVDGGNIMILRNQNALSLYETSGAEYIKITGTSRGLEETDFSDAIPPQHIEYEYSHDDSMKDMYRRIIEKEGETTHLDYRRWLYIVRFPLDIKNGGEVRAIFPAEKLKGLWLVIVRDVAITSLVLILIMLPPIYLLAWMFSKDLKVIVSGLRGTGLGQKVRLPDLGRNEIGEIARAFNRLEERLDAEVRRLQNLLRFGDLVSDEISEHESYAILTRFLTHDFKIDGMVINSFNNSENIAEPVTFYESSPDFSLPCSSPSAYEMDVIRNARLCRAVRSGKRFVVNDVKKDYRCPYQEVVQEKGSYACFPVATGGAVLGWVHLVNREKGYFNMEQCLTIESYINTLAPTVSSLRLLNAHRKMSIRDPLTGLYNRRFLDESLSKQLALAERYKQPFSVVMIDIDHFKKFNDTHGHAFGDRVLKQVADIIEKTVRKSDIVARYGGEEFIILLSNTDKDGALELAEKIRVAIEQYAMTRDDGVSEGITVSLGVSCFPLVANNMKELIESSDNALYRSKVMGRNRVTMAERGTNLEEKKEAE